MNFSITKNGKTLDPNLYNWDGNTRFLSTKESDLVLDFSDIDGCTFKTSDNCIFKTAYNCNFNTGSNCIFNTGDDCTFKTEDDCTFNVGNNCTFNTMNDCTFKTEDNCTLNIWSSYINIKHGKKCIAIIRTGINMKIIDFDNSQSVRFLKEA